MNIIIVLILASLVVALIFLFAFIYAVKRGQFDDTYSPSRRILFEEHDIGDQKEDETSK